ncbi:MAG: ferritin family protein [Magnetococcus sp. WYHC-3]
MGETGGGGFAQLQGRKTLADILDVAILFERTAFEFYSALITRVSKPLRYLVETLATEEQRHVDLFTEIRNRPGLEEQIHRMVDTPASDGRFSDAVHLPHMSEKPDDQEVLQYAMWREHTAMEQYRALSASTEHGPVRDLFEFLAEEELQHKKELEKLYYEVVHSGGV